MGSPVAAIGSPFGESQSLSVGVISATGRDIESLTAFKIGNAIQTDAAINHGNSGGPLLNSRGQVIGINSQIESTGGGGEGVGFAVPVDTVRRSLDELRAKGHVDYAYLGVTTQELYPQLAQRLGLPVKDGALVASVEPGGPAAKAGIHAGRGQDRVPGARRTSRPAATRSWPSTASRSPQSSDLPNLISLKSPGDKVSLTILRGKQRRTVTVTLGPRPDKPLPTTRPVRRVACHHFGLLPLAPTAAHGNLIELVRDLSLALREKVLPMLGSHAGRAHADELGKGGDVTFKIDEEAEALLESWLAERAPDVAFYSEDRGLVLPCEAQPRWCWWSTRSTARGRRWRGSSRAACRWPRRRCARRDDGRGERRLRGGDPVGRGVPRRARARAWSRARR